MKYKIGWKKNGKWHYIIALTHSEMLAEVADKTILSDKVSIRSITQVDLEEAYCESDVEVLRLVNG